MNKCIAIIAGEPNSISSEIIFKSWKLKNQFIHKPLFVIGSIRLLNLQRKKLKYQIKIKKINDRFRINDLKGGELPVYDIEYNQKKPFEKISNKSNKYIFKCFDAATKFVKDKKILGFINCPISKEHLFKNKYQGITEFLSKKIGKIGNEVMLIYNKKLSTSPVTLSKKSEEKEIINKAIKTLIKLKIKVTGPVAADSSFMIFKKYKFDVIIGMYHDQVLTPFKALYNFKAINITLGLPYIRISPDHGVAENITGKKIANPRSLIESIKFFNYIN